MTKEILRITAKYHPLGYAQLFEYLYDETTYGKKLNRDSVHTIVNRMEKNGLLRKYDERWSLTKEGKNSFNKKNFGIKKFFQSKNVIDNRMKTKNLIIIFDIPEKKKRYREWLRLELVGFGFTLIQKSVWLGPALPQEFIEYLSEVSLLKHVRFFRATEKDLI